MSTRRPRARRAPSPASTAAGGCRAPRARPRRSSPGSTCTGSGGSSPRSSPSSPAAIRPPSARYGFALASAAFSSTFVDASSAPANTDGTRTGASRLSWPQQVNAPAQYCGTMRRYELKLGAVRPQSAGQVREHARDERARLGREAVGRGGVVEAVPRARRVPQREVDVAAVAGVVRPRLRRERGDEAVPRRDAADRLAHEQLLVGRLQRRRVRGRDLVLAVAELGVVLLELDALRVERRDEVVDVVLRRGRADRREAEAGVDRHVRAVDLRRERELVLERHLEHSAALGQPRLHPLEERALAHGRRLAVEADVVGQHRAGVGRVRQDAERVEVGHEPHLADRPHALDRLQLVERRSSPACRPSARCRCAGAPPGRAARSPSRAPCRRCRTRGSGRAAGPPRPPAGRPRRRPSDRRVGDRRSPRRRRAGRTAGLSAVVVRNWTNANISTTPAMRPPMWPPREIDERRT